MAIDDKLDGLPLPAVPSGPAAVRACACSSIRLSDERAAPRLRAIGLDGAVLYQRTTYRSEGDHYGMYTVPVGHVYALLADGRVEYTLNESIREVMPFEKFIINLQYRTSFDGWDGCIRDVHARLHAIAEARRREDLTGYPSTP